MKKVQLYVKKSLDVQKEMTHKKRTFIWKRSIACKEKPVKISILQNKKNQKEHCSTSRVDIIVSSLSNHLQHDNLFTENCTSVKVFLVLYDEQLSRKPSNDSLFKTQ